MLVSLARDNPVVLGRDGIRMDSGCGTRDGGGGSGGGANGIVKRLGSWVCAFSLLYLFCNNIDFAYSPDSCLTHQFRERKASRIRAPRAKIALLPDPDDPLRDYTTLRLRAPNHGAMQLASSLPDRDKVSDGRARPLVWRDDRDAYASWRHRTPVRVAGAGHAGSPQGGSEASTDMVRIFIRGEDLEAVQERLIGRGGPSTCRRPSGTRATARSGSTTTRGRSASSAGSRQDDNRSGCPAAQLDPWGLMRAPLLHIFLPWPGRLAVPGVMARPLPSSNTSLASRGPERSERFHLPPASRSSGPIQRLEAAQLSFAPGDACGGRIVRIPFGRRGDATRDAVRILEDFGRREARTVRASPRLNIPLGVLPLSSGDEELVHRIPNIHRMPTRTRRPRGSPRC